MTYFLLQHFPTWMIMVVTAGIFYLIAHLFYTLVHLEVMRPYLAIRESDYVEGAILICTTLGTVILAFMIVAMWQNFHAVQQTVNDEADAIDKLMTFADLLTPAQTYALRAELTAYTESLVNDEWQQMHFNKSSQKTADSLSRLEKMVFILGEDPAIPTGYRAEMVRVMSSIIAARMDRLESLRSVVPGFFFALIFLLLLGMILLLCLMSSKQKKAQKLFIGIVSLLLGLSFSVIFILDYPFAGRFSISKQPFEDELLREEQLGP